MSNNTSDKKSWWREQLSDSKNHFWIIVILVMVIVAVYNIDQNEVLKYLGIISTVVSILLACISIAFTFDSTRDLRIHESKINDLIAKIEDSNNNSHQEVKQIVETFREEMKEDIRNIKDEIGTINEGVDSLRSNIKNIPGVSNERKPRKN